MHHFSIHICVCVLRQMKLTSYSSIMTSVIHIIFTFEVVNEPSTDI